MAYERPGEIIGNLNATADLSALQHTFVRLTTLGGIAGSTVFTQDPIGVLQNTPTSNQACEIMVSGISKLIAGTTAIVAGDRVGTTAGGLAVSYTSGTTGYVAGKVLEAALTSEVMSVYIFPAQRVI